MYSQSYNEYMRSVLGSSNMTPYSNMNNGSDDLERMYPDVYRVVYPMVRSACDNVRTPVTEEMVDNMTDDIYDRVEADGRINVEISFEVRSDEPQETRQRMPRRRNRFLRDLIRILLLRELLGRRRRPGFSMRPF